jgi:hypothetical protein
MECKKVLRQLDEYIDDGLGWQEVEFIDQHIRSCSSCSDELKQLQSFRRLMKSLARLEPPQNLSLQMRIRASKQQWFKALPQKLYVQLKDSVEPIAIPAVSGVVLTFLFFVPLLGIFFTGVNLKASDKDIPSGLFTEPRPQTVYLSQFVKLENFHSVREAITLEVDVAQDGSVRHYSILKGPSDVATVRSLDQFLYFEVKIDPATLFGRPTEGRVVLSLSFFPTSNEKIDVLG